MARHPDLLAAWRPLAREFDVFFGLEAATNDGLKGLVKDATVDQSAQGIAVARELGYGVTGNFVIDPAWNEQDFERLWAFVERFRLYSGINDSDAAAGTAFSKRCGHDGAREWRIRTCIKGVGAGARHRTFFERIANRRRSG